MKNKQKAKFSFGAYLSFFTRFPIPWWLFLLSLLLGFANTEVVLAVSNYLIRINKGELYNGVIIGYALMNVFNALLSMLINLTGGYGSALVTLRARKLLWRKILHLPMREVERRQPSALISGLVNDITQAWWSRWPSTPLCPCTAFFAAAGRCTALTARSRCICCCCYPSRCWCSRWWAICNSVGKSFARAGRIVICGNSDPVDL